MSRNPETIEQLREVLARIEHDRWSHWQSFLHQQGERDDSGNLVLPRHLVERWERQMRTPYGELSDAEKESDRDQVDRYLPEVVRYFSKP